MLCETRKKEKINMKNNEKIQKMVVTAILLALTIVLQAYATTFRIGTYSLPLSLVVIAAGAIMYGPLVGSILGTGWGLFIFVADPSCQAFIHYSVPGTIMAVIGRGFLDGFITGLLAVVFKKLFKFKYGNYLAIFIPALLLPFINNLIFFLCELTIFRDFIGMDKIIGSFFTLNLLISTAISFIMAPVIVRIVDASKYILHLEDKPKTEEENTNTDNIYSELEK
jgi:uncharacterized membrane protein